jgi:hypothetical protein
MDEDPIFFLLILFECTFTSFFKDKKSKRVHTSDLWIWIWEAQKHVDLVGPDTDLDPGPQHC